METLVVLTKKEEVHAQQMGDTFTFLIPGFGGPGNDLRVVLAPEAQDEMLKDMILVAKARTIEAGAKREHN